MSNQYEPLVSVIVPIYMIDRYIGICVESIINQTYKNLEIILVDDGSKDKCPEICDLYARKDNRIKVIHKANGGLVSARKAGLRESSGEYICYVDGDDWIGPGFVEALISSAIDSSAEVVCAGHKRDLFSKSTGLHNAILSGIYEGNQLTDLWRRMISFGEFYKPGITTYLWNKLFKRSIVLSPQFAVDDRISIGEDAAVSYPALLSCKKVAVVENCDYHYRQREDSMLKQQTSYAKEAKKLVYLRDFLMAWANSTPEELDIKRQVVEYILSIAIMRSGGRLPHDEYSTFDKKYFGSRVVVFSAGTFGQQLVNRFKETKHCSVVAWIDDDYWEYRRCCLDVDPVETINAVDFDFILLATVDSSVAETIIKRFLDLGIGRNRLLSVTVPDEKEELLDCFLNVKAIEEAEEAKGSRFSHA